MCRQSSCVYFCLMFGRRFIHILLRSLCIHSISVALQALVVISIDEAADTPYFDIDLSIASYRNPLLFERDYWVFKHTEYKRPVKPQVDFAALGSFLHLNSTHLP